MHRKAECAILLGRNCRRSMAHLRLYGGKDFYSMV